LAARDIKGLTKMLPLQVRPAARVPTKAMNALLRCSEGGRMLVVGEM
jgi:hypothetical protein